MSKFKIGDRVTIARKVLNDWVKSMDKTVGDTVTVDYVDGEWYRFQGYSYRYHESALELATFKPGDTVLTDKGVAVILGPVPVTVKLGDRVRVNSGAYEGFEFIVDETYIDSDKKPRFSNFNIDVWFKESELTVVP